MIGYKHLLWSSAAEDGTFKWCEPAEVAANRQARAVSNLGTPYEVTHDYNYIGYQAPNRPIGTQARCDSWAGAQPCSQPTLKSTYNGAIPTMVATVMTEEQTST